MNLNQKLSRIIIVTLCMIVSGCASVQLGKQAVDMNSAYAEAGDKVLLTNIIRSSYGYYPQFTTFTDFKGENAISGTVRASIPFGPYLATSNSISPEVSLNGGVQTYSIQNYGQTKAISKLSQRASGYTLLRLMDMGWPMRLILAIYLDSINIHPPIDPVKTDLSTIMYLEAEKTCASNKNKTSKNKQEQNKIEWMNKLCNQNHEIESSDCYRDITRYNAILHIDKCRFSHVKRVINIFEILDYQIEISRKTGDVVFYFDNKEIKDARKRIELEASGSNTPPWEITLRSTEQLIMFLGTLARLQLNDEKIYSAKIYMTQGASEETPIFTVKKSSFLNTDEAAVSAEFQGTTYYIPKTSYNVTGLSGDPSMLIFSHIIREQNAALSEVELPTTSAIIVRAPN